MRIVFVLGWRQFIRDRRRYTAATASLVMAFALFVGASATTSSIDARLTQDVEALGGIGQLGFVPSVNGDTFSESLLPEISALPDVALVVPTYSSPTTITFGASEATDALTVTGYPIDQNLELGDVVTEGRLPRPGERALAVPDTVAAEHSVVLGQFVTVAGSSEPLTAQVVGIVDAQQLGVLAYDNVFMSLPVVQGLFGKVGQLTRADATLIDGTSVSEWESRYESVIPDTVRFQSTAAFTSAVQPVLSTVRLILLVTTTLLALMSALISHHAVQSVIESRRPDYFALVANGASPRWFLRSLALEISLLVAIVGILGTGLGFIVSWGIATLLALGGGLPGGQWTIHWSTVGTAVLLVGILCAAGAVGPVKDAVRMSGQHERYGGRVTGLQPRAAAPKLPVVGLTVMVLLLSLALYDAASRSIMSSLVLSVSVIIALVVFGPGVARIIISRLSTHRAEWWLSAIYTSRVGIYSLPLRLMALTATVATTLAVVLGGVGTAVQQQIGTQFGADIQVSSSVPVDSDLTSTIRNVPGVEDVASISIKSSTFSLRRDAPEHETLIMFTPIGDYLRTTSLPWLRQPSALAREAVSQPRSIALPVGLAQRFSLASGDSVWLGDNGAKEEFRVGGIYNSLVSGNQIIVDSSAADLLGAARSDSWNISVKSGDSLRVVHAAVERQLQKYPNISVTTAEGMRERAQQQIGSYTLTAGALAVLALLLGALGSSGIFRLAVERRRPDMTLLRAFGLSGNITSRLIVREAVIVAGVASVLGVVAGLIVGYGALPGLGSLLSAELSFRISWWLLLVIPCVAVGVTLLVARGAVRSATHSHLGRSGERFVGLP